MVQHAVMTDTYGTNQQIKILIAKYR